MTIKTKKGLIIASGVLVGLATVGLLIWSKVKKLMNFEIGVKSFRFKSLSLTSLSMDIVMKFTNKSDLTIVLTKQQYEVYINGIYLTTLKSSVEQTIFPMATSALSIQVDVNPKDLLSKLPNKLDLITNYKEQDLKLVTKLWVKFGAISIPVTISYEAKIKNWA